MRKPSRKSQILSVFSIVLVLSLLPLSSPSAAPPLDPPNPPTLPEFARGTVATAKLIESNGNRSYALVPSLVQVIETDSDSFQITYEVGIPKQYLDDDRTANTVFGSVDPFPFVAYASSESHNRCDSTVSVCALLTLNYTQVTDHGWYQNTTNRWTRSDSTVTWSNALLKAGCSALWYLKSGTCNTIVTKTIGVPTSGTTYSYTPSFAGSSNQVYLNDLNGIAAYQNITLKRGTSTWQFSFCVNHEGSLIIQGCY